VSSILGLNIHLLQAHFYMESENPKVNGLSGSRFSSIIFLFRLGGIPLKMKKISTVYTIYMITFIICSGSTYVGMFVDVYVHRDDLGHAMTNIRVLVGITSVVWVYFSCR
jgi:hypothetical protein